MDSKTNALDYVLSLSDQEKMVNLLTFEKIKAHLSSQIEQSKDGSYRREREKFRLLIAQSKIDEWTTESRYEIQSQYPDHSS